MGKRKTQDEIIQGFIKKHGNKYDYSKVFNSFIKNSDKLTQTMTSA